ncbi:hypothetical protein P280DRAFT_520575 [Massarina eburnea CBS 473.64]|uniref:Uncharacterized protein n=1 Tax=Massarina eburnea CBS 473.64 TaxID=1395130 RepID=A0A6A6RRA4_9PLEO|nr:hypothetical protein P280DRAFT_520575 [Massarina eburnea CBS 473.64]
MDPSKNPALYDTTKIQTLLQSLTSSLTNNLHPSSYCSSEIDSSSRMPPPPAYHMVVDPNSPIPNMHNNPFDQDHEDDEVEREEGGDDEVPEVNINASTQIRGHGNIISITQMDTVRMAGLIAGLLHGGPLPMPVPASTPSTQPGTPVQEGPQTQAQAQAQASSQQAQAQTQAQSTSHHQRHRMNLKGFPKINITLNCGATVVGDRNIVGPGLGDIARHMQIAQQRNQALAAAAQQNVQNAQNAAHQNAGQHCAQKTTCAPAPVVSPGSCGGIGFPVHVGAQPTPPMSRSSSFGSTDGVAVKRKAEECCGERGGKRMC